MTPNTVEELEELKQLLREYLKYNSCDGRTIRQQLRQQLKEKVA